MTKKKSLIPATGEFLLYTTADGHIRIETRMQGETVWLTQKQLAELFQTSIPNINMHIKNIFEEGELSPDSVIQESLIAAADGKSYRTKFYNLDMIDWVVKLDDFLKISDREILTHAGTVSHEKALRKAHEEYEKYRHAMLEQPTPVEQLFMETAKKLERINHEK